MARATAGSELTTACGPAFLPAWAGEQDNPALRRLLRDTPMPGRIRITLEREPDFFRAAELEWNRHYTAVARDPVSSGVRHVQPFCANGVCERSACPPRLLSQLRISPAHRAHKLRLLKTGFTWLAGTVYPRMRRSISPPWLMITALPGAC